MEHWLRTHRWMLASGTVAFLVLYLLATQGWPRLEAAFVWYEAWRGHTARLAEIAEAPAVLAALQAEQRGLERRLEELYVNLPASDHMSVVLQVLHDGAGEAGGVLRQVKPGSREEHPLHETIPIELTFEGSYYALARFVHHIEQSEYLVQVRALALKSTGTPDGRLQAALSLRVVTLQPGEVQP